MNDPRNRIHLIQVFRHVEASDQAITNLLFKNSKLILCTIKTNTLDEYILYMSKGLIAPEHSEARASHGLESRIDNIVKITSKFTNAMTVS